MKNVSLHAAGASFVYFMLICCLPVMASALPDSPVVISEVQTGTANSASEEFIEITNISDKPVDLDTGHWQIITASASAKDWAPYRTADLHGILAPGQAYMVASTYSSGGVLLHYLPEVANATFTAGLSASGGHVRLTYTSNGVLPDNTCGPVDNVADTVEWSMFSGTAYGSPSITGRTPFGLLSKVGVPSTSTLQRRFAVSDGSYVDTDNDADDFSLALPTPGLPNLALTLQSSPFILLPLEPAADTCDPNQPAPSSGTGPTEPSESSPPPTDGGVDGAGPDDGENDNTGNILLPPAITELLPNPAAPQTDANDEFIELYNPNDAALDVSGYTIEAGGTTMRRYTLPAGTILPAHAYQAYFASATGISLPNDGGSARLLDAAGGVVTQTDPYGAAADGQAWAMRDGVWGWSTTPSPSAENVFTAVITAAKKSVPAAKTTTKKTTAVKAATTAKPKTAKPKVAAKPKKSVAKKTELAPVAAAVRNPVHTGVLAAIAVFALLYGAYEYRHDLANKFNQLRSNRAARRAARQRVARR